jgi:hypothetical protein
MDKSEQKDGPFSRRDFTYDPESNVYVCPGGKELKKCPRAFSKPRGDLTKDGALLREKAGLQRLRAEAKMLPEPASAQDRALRS